MPRSGKIKSLDELAALAQSLRAQGKRIVHSHGVFDLLHIGHIRHFEQARKMGDVLMVTITQDQYANKGPHRPVFTHDLRADAVAALDVVNYVAINRWPVAVEAIKLLRPEVYAKGPDYKDAKQDITGGIVTEKEAVESVGGEIRFTEGMTFSSSNLLNQHFSPFTAEVDAYLEDFSKRHPIEEVLNWIERAARLRPLVTGEAIIDEYLFCTAIGKSTKDPILAVQRESLETCAGGSLAIANHLAGICEEVSLVTQLGETERREDFVRSALRPNVQAVFLTKSSAPTIHKRRIVESYSGSKLLEVYQMNARLTDGPDEAQLRDALAKMAAGRDLTVVADYGHGMFTSSVIEWLCAEAPFLTVNVQSNAGNFGFNPLSKYRRADYVCLTLHEVNMEARRRDGNATERILDVARCIQCPRFTITTGKHGSIHYDRETGFMEAPSLATKVLDRVGAGDAVLAVTSLLTRLGAPWDIVAFVGNVAGAQLVAELGNRTPLARVALSKHITALMKW